MYELDPDAKNFVTSYGLPVAKPEEVGMSAERLARIKPTLQAYIQNCEVPGLLTILARYGKIVHIEAQGYKPDTIFRLFSMTKPITGVAVMILYEEGRFFLDDPIEMYLPEFASMKVWTEKGLVPANKPITIRHLLTHTAGLTYMGLQSDPAFARFYDEGGNEALDRLSGKTLERHVKKLSTLPLLHHPGTKWNYGESMAVLARMVEVLTGEKFGDYLADQLFEPLRMVDTGYSVPKHKVERLAALYEQGPDGIQLADTSAYGGDYSVAPSLQAGGAGLVGTATDYLRFAQMLLNGGELDGVRILSPTTVELIMSDHLPPEFGDMPLASLEFPVSQGPGLGFGFCGLVVRKATINTVPGSDGEYSWSGWASTDFWIDPKQELIGLVFTQLIPNRKHITTRARMRQMTYQAIVGK